MQFSSIFIAALVANSALAGNPRLHQRAKSQNGLQSTGTAATGNTATSVGNAPTGSPKKTGKKGGNSPSGTGKGMPSGTGSGQAPHSTGTGHGKGGNSTLSGLDSTQSKNAQAILQQIQKEDLGSSSNKACWAVFATGLQESQLYIYANPTVPASMNISHDKVGNDHDSVGIFQQRVTFYPDVKADMDPAQSTSQFLKKLKAVPSWQSMDTADLCQKIQVAEAGNLYGDNVAQAQKICSTSGLSASGSGTAPSGPHSTGTPKKSGKGGNPAKTNSAKTNTATNKTNGGGKSQSRTASSGVEPTLPATQ